MIIPARRILLTNKLGYSDKIKRIFGTSIIAYWPLWEASNSIAHDISGNSRNGAYTGVDLGYPGIGDGHTSPYFDGATDYVNVYSASLAAAFNGSEGTIIIWLKAYDANMWTDGSRHYVYRFGADANNYLVLYKYTDNSVHWQYKAGGTLSEVIWNLPSGLTYLQFSLTWSKSNDRVIAYKNGMQYGTTQTSLGTWAGTFGANLCLIGASSVGPLYVMNGYISDGIVLNREATPSEMLKAAQV